MKFYILNNEPVNFYNTNGDLTGQISISASGDMTIQPTSGSGANLILGNPNTVSDVEFGSVAAPVSLTLLGGGTLSSNGNILTIGNAAASDVVRINNVSFSQSLALTGSLSVTGSTAFNGSLTVSGLSILNSLNATTITATQGVTGSLFGTASNAVSSSYADSASYATIASNAASAAYATIAADATGIGSSITNNTNNNILTATGTGVINGESNLTFDSQILTLTNGNLTFAGSTLGRIQQSPGGVANGLFSHAQGLAVNANGEYSHAEGSSTNASGFGSHAEGSGSVTFTARTYGGKSNTITSGVFQLAGDVTTEFAPGSRLYYNSAAYPDNTSFVVDTAVFGGVNTTITLTNTGITDSNYVVASLDYAYTAWGGNQISSAAGGHAEGYYTTAVADWSHAEGYQTQTFGRYTHAEGYGTQANGIGSHAEGRASKTFGAYSHAEGSYTIASGSSSHAEGSSTQANGDYSHAEGESTTANGYGSHAEGSSTYTHGVYSHAEGNSTAAGSQYGYLATVSTPGVVVVDASYGDLTLTGTGLFTAGTTLGIDDTAYDNSLTFTNQIILSCSFDGTNTIINLLETSISTTSASIGSVSSFGSNAGDQYWGGWSAHSEGNGSVAIGFSTHAEGSGYAFGNNSHAEGGGYAYSDYSHAEGAGQSVGQYSHAEGSGYTYSNNSHAEGAGTAGVLGFGITIPIASGVIELDAKYGDQTAQFVAGGFVIVDDNQGEIVPGVVTAYIYEIASSTFNGTPATEITLVDTSVNTASNKARIGIYGVSVPTAADISIGNSSHAEGEQTQTIGTSAHAAGFDTRALGYYQSVVGQFNQPISQPSAFIVGDGVDDSTRHNLLVAASGSVAISGSLIVSSSAAIGFTSLVSTENTLTLGPPPAGGTGEGGQLGLAAAGGAYTSASFIDNWQNQFRILRGTNASSNAGLMYVDLQNGNTNFVGAVTASGGYSNLPNDYLYATRATSNQTIGSGTWADRDIIFNNTVVSKGISYNTGTGLASLTGGKVYRVTARLAWSAAAAYNLQFSCYDSSNTQIGPTVEIIQSINGTNNISDGTLDFIYAPASNTDIKIRTTSATNALTGEAIRYDLNTQFIIQQIA